MRSKIYIGLILLFLALGWCVWHFHTSSPHSGGEAAPAGHSSDFIVWDLLGQSF